MREREWERETERVRGGEGSRERKGVGERDLERERECLCDGERKRVGERDLERERECLCDGERKRVGERDLERERKGESVSYLQSALGQLTLVGTNSFNLNLNFSKYKNDRAGGYKGHVITLLKRHHFYKNKKLYANGLGVTIQQYKGAFI